MMIIRYIVHTWFPLGEQTMKEQKEFKDPKPIFNRGGPMLFIKLRGHY